MYYRIYLNTFNKLCVVAMQDIDELDYIQSRFYRNEDNVPEAWDTEDEARCFLNNAFKPEYISVECLTPNNREFFIER